jgi:hypothetical protein
MPANSPSRVDSTCFDIDRYRSKRLPRSLRRLPGYSAGTPVWAWPGIRGWSILDALQVTARARGQKQLVLDVSVDLESIGAAQEFLHRRLRTLAGRSRPIRPQVSRQILNQLVLDDN